MEETNITQDKTPVVPTLRAMSVGDVAYFPMGKLMQLRNAPTGALRHLRNEGWAIRIEPDDQTNLVKVTRLS